MNDIKVVIFDWGRTLHNPDTDGLFDGVAELVRELSSRGYVLALVSLAKSQDPKTRRRVIEESGIAQYFKLILVGDEGKDDMYERVLRELGVRGNEVVVVDDRVVRGIAWGNKVGAKTIWFQNGKFANELPTSETGTPTHTITDTLDLSRILEGVGGAIA